MGKSYKHLNQEERDKVAVLRSCGWTWREIAEKLGRHYSSLSREFNRNSAKGQYLPHKAQERCDDRQNNGHKRKRLKTYAIRCEVEQKLLLGWSPEQIAGRLKLKYGKTVISHEAIYQWIYAEAPYLAHYLTRRHRNRMPKHSLRKHRGKIPCRIALSERPAAANSRKEEGHWESDLLVSKKSKVAVEVCVERRSRFCRVGIIDDKSAVTASEKVEALLVGYPKALRKSITYDNGLENILHESVNEKLGTKSYFCQPYHSWEKGTVENTNGVIRRFLPKKTDFSMIDDRQMQEIETWLNNRPMRCLGWRTPAEVFNSFVALTT